ncbi:hypothetical protein [Vibrio anguillarum]|uniref:Uncharacterized protein n=1 Tax=Vibrio anguillarum TaxID=55601 RepID=A0A7U6FS17_VIBAN|nr:hypothetical protein [Vibrio anguillarum]AZS26275.1 hypothetical protein DYL72_15310 [Vibrio anguillarum]MBF4374556.1 hypothetical protein [Vibrio anguillarum]
MSQLILPTSTDFGSLISYSGNDAVMLRIVAASNVILNYMQCLGWYAETKLVFTATARAESDMTYRAQWLDVCLHFRTHKLTDVLNAVALDCDPQQFNQSTTAIELTFIKLRLAIAEAASEIVVLPICANMSDEFYQLKIQTLLNTKLHIPFVSFHINKAGQYVRRVTFHLFNRLISTVETPI